MKKGFLTKLTAFILMIIILPINAKAVTFSISKSADNLKPGGTSTIIINAKDVTEQDSVSAYNLNVNFDNSKLEYAGGESSGTGVVTASGNVVNIRSTFSDTKGDNFEVAKFNLRVIGSASSGNAKLELSGSCDINGEAGSCSTNGSQITVAALGTDASLNSLKIPNTTLKPAFSSSVTNYTATIQDITDLTVNAVPSDSNAKVSISENAKSLQKGENKIDVTVVSEDGQSRKTYTVVVTLNLTPTDEELLKANATLKALTIKGQKLDFESTEKKYYITVPYETTKLSITATPANAKAKVEISGEKKLIVGKNNVKITVTSEDKSKIENYQIIVTRQDEEKEIVQTCPDETSTREWILFSVAMLITFTLGIVLGYFLCKKDVFKKLFTKKPKKEEVPVEIETLSDTIDLSNTVKEVKKKNKKKQDK